MSLKNHMGQIESLLTFNLIQSWGQQFHSLSLLFDEFTKDDPRHFDKLFLRKKSVVTFLKNLPITSPGQFKLKNKKNYDFQHSHQITLYTRMNEIKFDHLSEHLFGSFYAVLLIIAEIYNTSQQEIASSFHLFLQVLCFLKEQNELQESFINKNKFKQGN